MPCPEKREAGSGTVLVVGAVVVLVFLTVAALQIGAAAVTAHRARLAADTGALAAAQVIQLGGTAAAGCARGEQVARANGATAVACRPQPAGVVAVSAGVDLPIRGRIPLPGLPRSVTAQARAGPTQPAGT